MYIHSVCCYCCFAFTNRKLYWLQSVLKVQTSVNVHCFIFPQNNDTFLNFLHKSAPIWNNIIWRNEFEILTSFPSTFWQLKTSFLLIFLVALSLFCAYLMNSTIYLCLRHKQASQSLHLYQMSDCSHSFFLI